MWCPSGMYLWAAPLTTFYSPSLAVEQTSRYVGECCFLCCVLSLSLSLCSRSFVKIQRILHLIVDLKTLSCKKERKSAPCEKELAHAETSRARLFAVYDGLFCQPIPLTR